MKSDRLEKPIGSFLVLSVLSVFLCFSSVPVTLAQLAESPWPKDHHNIYNNANVNDERTNRVNGPESAKIKWKKSLDNEYSVCCETQVIGPNGTIYVSNGSLYAIKPNGEIKWKIARGNGFERRPIISNSGTIYARARYPFKLYAIDSAGSVLWETPDQMSIHNSTALGYDKTLYVGANYRDSSRVVALNTEGDIKWSYPYPKSPGDGTPQFYDIRSIAIGKEFTLFNMKHLLALDGEGNQHWKGSVDKWSSPVIGPYGNIYVCTYDYIKKYTPDGSLEWEFKPDGVVFGSSPTVSKEGYIYIGDRANNLYKLDSNGKIVWKFEANGDITSSPMIDGNGTLYVRSWDDFLYAINPDGTLLWKYKIGSGSHEPPAMDQNGNLYVMGYDTLYAFEYNTNTSLRNRESKPDRIKLNANHPNPFNPATNIKFNLPRALNVELEVYNSVGQKVSTLVNRRMTNGTHSVMFDAQGLPSGIYIYRLKAGDYSDSKKMLLVK